VKPERVRIRRAPADAIGSFRMVSTCMSKGLIGCFEIDDANARVLACSYASPHLTSPLVEMALTSIGCWNGTWRLVV